MKGFIKAETIEPSLDITLKIERFDRKDVLFDKELEPIDFANVDSEEGFTVFVEQEKRKQVGRMSTSNIRLMNEYESNYGLGFKLLSQMEGFEIGKGLGKGTSGISKPVKATKKNYIGEKDGTSENKYNNDISDELKKLLKKNEYAETSIKLKSIEKFLGKTDTNTKDITQYTGLPLMIALYDKYNRMMEKLREDKFNWSKQMVEIQDKINLVSENVEQAYIESNKIIDFCKICVVINNIKIKKISEGISWIDSVYKALDEYSIEFLESKFIYYVIDKLSEIISDSGLGLVKINNNTESFYVRLFLFFSKYRAVFNDNINIINLSERHFSEIVTYFIENLLYNVFSKYILTSWDYEDPAEIVEIFSNLKILEIDFCDELLINMFKTKILTIIEDRLNEWSGESHGIIPFIWILPWKQFINLLHDFNIYSLKLSRLITKKISKVFLVNRTESNDLIHYIQLVKTLLEPIDIKYLITIVLVPMLLYEKLHGNHEGKTNDLPTVLEEFDCFQLYNDALQELTT